MAFAPQNSLRHYIKAMQTTDQTFKGLYHWNPFDLALLLPYFAVMIALAVYGVHRYTMVYVYYKYKKNYQPNPAQYFDELPRVTVQLPIFNEQFVIDRLIEAVCAMEYPREKLEIQVLDDSTDETQAVAAGIVARYAALGNPSSISIAPTAWATKRARSMPASRSPRASSSPSSTPTLSRPKTGS